MARRIDLCGIQMNTGTPDSNGARWKVTRLGDWASPSQTLKLGEATGRPGATLLQDFHAEHTVTLEGVAYGTLAAVDAAADQVNRMPGVGNAGDLIVYESVPKLLRVRQGGIPKAEQPEPRDGTWGVAFQLALTALDPYKRGLTARTLHLAPGQTGTVANAGTAPVILSLKATTAGTVVVRQGTSGQVLRTRTTVPAGTTFDGPSRTVTTAAGVVVFPMGAPSEWLAAPPAGSADLTNQGTAGLDVTWFDTYA